MTDSLLTWIVFTPTIGAIILLFLPNSSSLLKRVALATTLVTFALSLWLF